MATVFGRISQSPPLTDLVLVCDLDETFIHTLDIDFETHKALKNEHMIRIHSDPHLMDIRKRSLKMSLDDTGTARGTGIVTACWCVKRPHLEEFLEFAFGYFKYICVWSAGVRSYVEEISRLISKDTPSFEVVYSRYDCYIKSEVRYDEKGNPYEENVYYKPLQQLVDAYPQLGGLDKMLIIDDNIDNFKYNPDNGILMPKYYPQASIDSLRQEDDTLPQLKTWLENLTVEDREDIRRVPKSSIFTYGDHVGEIE